MSGVVRYETRTSSESCYAVITLDSDRNRNALSWALLDELDAALARAAKDQARAVLLRAEGKVFSAGADLTEAHRDGMEKGLRKLVAVMRAIVTLPVPVVARVHGAARAGGLGLVAACDVAIAAEHVNYAFTEVKLGLAPATIALAVLPRMEPRTAALTFLTGEPFDGRTAVESGLITRVVPSTELDEAVAGVMAQICSGEPQGLAATKQLLNADVVRRFDEHAEDVIASSAVLFASDIARAHMARFVK